MDTSFNKTKTMRKTKGKSLLMFPEDYVVLDLETTDFDYFYGDIIEIAAKKYRNYKLVDEFTSLIKPNERISDFITKLTGISDEMVSDSPMLKDVMIDLVNFLEDEIIVAHNANFDINFLYDASQDLINYEFRNDFVDTLRLSRLLIKDSKNHKLHTLSDYFHLKKPAHRAEADVAVTQDLYLKLLDIFLENPDSFIFKRSQHIQTDFSLIQSTIDVDLIDKNNYFYGKNVCFTGKMDVLTKKEASQAIANLGASIQNNVVASTNVLVLGNLNYQMTQFGKKSNKHEKADKLAQLGNDIEIMTEITFLELIEQ